MAMSPSSSATISLAHRLSHRGDHRERCTCSARTGGSSAFPASPSARRARGARSRGYRRSPARRSTASSRCEPDLVLGFSDLQADIASELIRGGVEVHVFNQRSVADILRMLRTLGGMIGCEAKSRRARRRRSRTGSRGIRAAAARLERRPRVYFEEWDEPQISAIRWVSELIGIAGGDDVFPELARRAARQGTDHRRSARGGAARAGHRSSARGAARSSARARLRRGPAGRMCRRCATASCTRSSRRSSCSPGRRR